MVKTFYLCTACNFLYIKKNKAKECEQWCKKYKSCNINITKETVGKMEKL